MKEMIQEAPREIKVQTEKFLLKKGKIYLAFRVKNQGDEITALYLKQRNSIEEHRFPFELQQDDQHVYRAEIDVARYPMAVAFWDITADVKNKEESYEAILGGISSKLKLKLILFPRWTKTTDGHLIYPFVNGARQFTIQYRPYDKRYDSYSFLMKEYLALFCYGILKPYWDKKKWWLVCEKFCTMAQDNGLYFFRYCMEQLPEEEKKHILYVIDKKAPDYQAVKQYDSNVIQFMSFKYMIYLCAAQYLISTDAIRHFYIWDSPNSVFKVLYQARKHIVFLQHGVMAFKQCHRTFHKSGGNKMALFVVSSEFEQDIIHDYFEYDREEIIITGLPRWDVLHSTASLEKKQILLMPTWRSWLEYASDEEFVKSDYYRNYKALLENESLHQMLEQYDLTLTFYIHPKFRDYIEKFKVENQRIELIPFGTEPLNKLLMSCNLLITDYSSVAWDVYYQEKPVVFFPFDLETYEERQGSYIDMEKDAFGDVVHTVDELLETVAGYVQNEFKEKEQYIQRREELLPYRDDKNSERIYQNIKAFKGGKKLDIKGKL